LVLDPNKNTLEQQKFRECPTDSGLPVVAVLHCGPIDTNQSGLNDGGTVTEVTLSSAAWVALQRSGSTNPTGSGPLTNRNAICIQNLSGQAILINYVNGAGVTIGIRIADGGQRYYDISDAVIIYGRATQAGSPKVIVEEIA